MRLAEPKSAERGESEQADPRMSGASESMSPFNTFYIPMTDEGANAERRKEPEMAASTAVGTARRSLARTRLTILKQQRTKG